MKKGPSLSLSGLGQALTKFLWRYHIMLYTMTVLVGVAVAVFLLSNVILASPDAPTPQPDQSRFDDKTINLIDSFNSASSGQDSFAIPPGRANPFAE